MLRDLFRICPWVLVLIGCLLSLSSILPAQTSTSDGHTLMQSAIKLNGLSDPDLHPWHLKVSYTLTDDTGKSTGTGTLEEFWAGPTRFKVIIAAPGYTQTEYGTDKDILLPATPQPLPEPVLELEHDLIAPLPSADAISYEDFLIEQKSVGTTKLACVAARAVTDKHKMINTGLVYCLDADKPILRLRDNTSDQTRAIYNVLAVFQGRYIARDLRLIRGGKPELAAHLETLEPLSSVNPADFTPPAGESFVPHSIRIAPDVAERMLLHKTRPPYPVDTAGQSGTVGTVDVQARIDTGGHVKDAKAVSGPLILHQSAVDAVQQWLYRPFLLNGEPVNVLTTIHVDFDPFQ